MTGFEDVAFATRLRDAVRRITQTEVARLRPAVQYGIVQSYNRATRKASVLMAGDTTPINVSMGSLQPSANGQRVRVEGPSGDKYITDVVGALPYVDGSLPRGRGSSTPVAGEVSTMGASPNANYTSGFWETANSSAMPTTDWYLIEVMAHSNPTTGTTYQRQIAWQMTVNGAYQPGWTRYCAGGDPTQAGSWSAWERISGGDPAWRAFGAAGQPAFVNGWSNYGDAGFGASGFRKTADGLVVMRGLIAGGTTAVTAFTLPVGYRPNLNLIFSTMADGTPCEMRIFPGGEVQIYRQAPAWASIACTFHAA